MTNKRVAFVSGIGGQDGAYLSAQLLENGWTVYGGCRGSDETDFWRLKQLGIDNDIIIVDCPLDRPGGLSNLLGTIKPQQIYHLAAMSSVIDSVVLPQQAIEINTLGTLHLLNAMKEQSPSARLFFASSSEVFAAKVDADFFDEHSPMLPQNPYGISKLAAQQLVSHFRQFYNLFTCSGILFNHESPLRGHEFVTRKITKQLVALKMKGGKPLELGNFDAAKDWGAAEDYTRAMRLMLDLDAPEDFVIASGRLTTVRELLVCAAKFLGYQPVFAGSGMKETCRDNISGALLAKVNPVYYRHSDYARKGCSEKLSKATNWIQTTKITDVIQDMVRQEAMYQQHYGNSASGVFPRDL